MSTSDSPAARRPRYTLRVLLAAVAVVALVVTWVNMYRLSERNRMLIAENQRLRDEVGELSVEDESQFHAIQVTADDELEWMWRIWVPPGRSYKVRSVGEQIPKAGFSQGGGTLMLQDSGEHWVRYRIERDPRDNRWRGKLSARGGSVGGDEHAWVEWGARTSTSDGVGKSTQVFPADERVLLIRHRVSQATSSDKIEDPSAGFLIWLEPN
jgi:hypothetical protein